MLSDPTPCKKNIEEDPQSYKSPKKSQKWSRSEHIKFIKGCLVYGKNYRLMQNYICTRSTKQIRKHAKSIIQSLSKKFKYDPNEKFDEGDIAMINERNWYLDQDLAEKIILIILTQEKIVEIANANQVCPYELFYERRGKVSEEIGKETIASQQEHSEKSMKMTMQMQSKGITIGMMGDDRVNSSNKNCGGSGNQLFKVVNKKEI